MDCKFNLDPWLEENFTIVILREKNLDFKVTEARTHAHTHTRVRALTSNISYNKKQLNLLCKQFR